MPDILSAFSSLQPWISVQTFSGDNGQIIRTGIIRKKDEQFRIDRRLNVFERKQVRTLNVSPAGTIAGSGRNSVTTRGSTRHPVKYVELIAR
ncbi:hypothetical protein RB195_025921 [Necator americanus]|uniref:Uncharacterized protein n=1 Tax=Necator americanus TaxID=51031 RepID=A0ABR1EUJ9_NECAM